MRYIPELDGLRAIAVIAVVLFHCAPHGAISGGFLGVDLFFVLSGYLITSILSAELRAKGAIDLKRFYFRRFRRLMPALLLMLCFYAAVAPLVWPSYPHGRDAVIAGLYVSDYTYWLWHVPLYLQHTWSLAVEEHFYLLWPLLLPLLLRTRRPVFWLLTAFLATTVWRAAQGDWTSYYYRFDTHATGLILGCALALTELRLPRAAAPIAAAVLAILFVVADIRFAEAYIPLAELAAASLIVSRPTVLAQSVLVGLGRISYGIYLYHFPIAYALRGTMPFAATAAVTLGASIALAWLSWHTVEAWARRSKPAVATAAP